MIDNFSPFSPAFLLEHKKPVKLYLFNFLLTGFTLLLNSGVCLLGMKTGAYCKHCLHLVFVCLFCCFTSQVNSYGHCGMVSSPNHTFFLGKLEQAVNQ